VPKGADNSSCFHQLILSKGPFATKVTSDYLLITEIACNDGSALARRHALPEVTPEPTALYIRGAKPPTLAPVVKKKNAVGLPELSDHLKRQAPANTTSPPQILMGEASRLIQQLYTVLYTVGVINSGTNLGERCLELQSANAILDLARVGLNATQAAAIVCTAALPGADLMMFNQTLVGVAATGLYAVQVAANFTGTVDTVVLCNQLSLRLLRSGFGVDIGAVQTYVCNAKNATITASTTFTLPTNLPSVGTLTPYPQTNSSGGFTWASSITLGTAVTAPWGTGLGASGTGATAPWGTGIAASGTAPYPSSNDTAGNAVNATGNLSTGTGIIVTGNLPAGTGTGTVGTGSLPTGTGIAGSATDASATGGTLVGEVSSSADSGSSLGGYGQETSDRVPRGPTSTPRYYPRYF
jgi:hypothetical protein